MFYGTFRPDHKVIIRRAASGYVDDDHSDISGDVVSITTNKAYARAAGGFQITTTFATGKDGLRHDERLQTDDIVLISLDAGDDNGMQSVMVGLIDRVGRVRQYGENGVPQYRCRISGTDFGKLLTKHNCILDFQPLRDSKTGKVEGGEGDMSIARINRGLGFSGTPQKLITDVFKVLFTDQLPLAADYCGLWFPDETPDDWQTYNFPITESTGAVWNAMKSLANEPFNALSTETYDGRLYVILEKFPFDDTSGYLTLENESVMKPTPGGKTRGRMRKIVDALVINEDLGIADNERINYVYLHAPAFILAGQGIGPEISYIHGIWNDDVEIIKKHGFMPWDVNIANFCPPIDAGVGAPLPGGAFNPIRSRAEILWNRVKNNHLLESGNITVHGAPLFKVGDGVLMKNGNEYFVEQVTHTYNYSNAGTSYTTSLGLTRGQK